MSSPSFPATVGQRLLWLMSRRAPALGTLNCPLAVRITGRLDADRLNAALEGLSDRHEALRTVFSTEGRSLTQQVTPPGTSVAPLFVDLRSRPDPGAALQDQLDREFSTPLDPTRSTTRHVLWLVTDDEHVLSLTQHHLITDSWSCGLLFRELSQLYQGIPLTPPAGQYRDFANHQERLFAGHELDRHRAYWQERLLGTKVLPFGRPAIPPPAFRSSTTGSPLSRLDVADLEPQLGRQIRAFARAWRVTVFPVFLAAFCQALHRNTGVIDLPVASLLTGRLRPQLQGIVGFLATMVILRTCWDPAASAGDLLRRTQETVNHAMAYQELPYHLLPPDLTPAAGGRLDDVVFHVLPDPGYRVAMPDATFELLVPQAIGSRFGIELAVAARGEGYQALLFTRRDWVDDTWGPGILAAVRDALLAMLRSPEAPFGAGNR